MTYSVELYRGGWQDISNSVIKISEIPFINRNRDFTPIAKPIRISISENDSYIPYVYDDLIQVKSDSTVIWSGYISDSTHNYNLRTYELVVENDLMLMEKEIIDVGNPAFSGGAFQYDTGGTYPLVNLLYFLKEIFDMSGLTLSTTEVDAEILFTHYFASNIGIPYNRLVIDENELRVLGQDQAANYATISVELDYPENQITAWDFAYNIIGNLRLGLVITANRTYKLILATSNFSISDNTKWSYQAKDIKAQYENVSLSVLTTTQVVAAGVVLTDMILTKNEGKGSRQTRMIDGLAIRYYNYSGGFDNTTADNALDPRYLSGLTMYNPVIAQIDALNQNYTEERIITDATLTHKSVLLNAINIQERTSRIIQETFQFGDNLVMNGNMENDSNWTDYNSPNINERSTGQVNNGTYSRKIETNGGTGGATSKSFDVIDGETYRVEAWVFDVNGSAHITDANNRLNFSVPSAGVVWEKLTVDVTATSTGTESIRILCDGGEDVAYFDDITIRKVN